MNKIKYPNKFTKDDYIIDTPEAAKQKIDALIKALTVDEKCNLLGGAKEPASKGKIGNAGYQWGVPRLGIPEVVMYDGPAGITGVVETTGLPQPSLLGCTWDDEMAYLFGKVSASENAACSGNFLLAPQIDMIRTPHFLRNKDMKTEDSYQCARMAVAETKGVQDNHAVATLKHFVAANIMGHGFVVPMTKTVVDEQTLHECYLRPFEEAILKGNAGSVMSAYNFVNGDYMTANQHFNKEVLRDMWGFKGSVMSDWGAVHEFTIDRGMDIEMPYPAYNDKNRILKNIRRGRMTWEDLDKACRHVLYGMSVIGLLGLVKLDEQGNVLEDPDHKEPIQMTWYYDDEVKCGLLEENAEIAAEIVRKGIVLAKNEGSTLPLSKKDMEGNIVLVGAGAKYPICGELQERSFGCLERMIAPKEAFKELAGSDIPVEPGIDYVGEVISGEYLFQDEHCTRKGVVRTFGILPEDRAKKEGIGGPGGAGLAFKGEEKVDEDGDTVNTGIDSYASADEHYPADYPLGQVAGVDFCINRTCGTDEKGNIIKNYLNGINGDALTAGESYTWKGYLKAPENGEYTLMLEAIGGEACFFIQMNNNWVQVGSSMLREWTQWPWEMLVNSPEGMGITGKKIVLEENRVYPILVYGRQGVKNKDLQIRAAWATPNYKKMNYERAMKAAAGADTIIFYTADAYEVKNMFDTWMQGFRNIDLADEQQKLLRDILDCKKPDSKLITVLQTSNARVVSELDKNSDALLITYMPGQEGSRIIPEIILGETNPSGKLSQTWPRAGNETSVSDSDEHFYIREEGIKNQGEISNHMEEGIFTGYRWYDKYDVDPLYPFGHGLSYTTFEYTDLLIESKEREFNVTFQMKNSGNVIGDEVVQLYLGEAEVPAYIQSAKKQLVGYTRVKQLKPDETRIVSIPIEERMLCYWDPALQLQKRENGTKDKGHQASGKRMVYVGSSSRDIRLEGEIVVPIEGTYFSMEEELENLMKKMMAES